MSAICRRQTNMLPPVILVVGLVQYVFGTFPPVNNPPPIPNQAVRTLDNSPQQFYIQEDLSQSPPQPNVRDGPYPPDKDEQRWYFQERQPVDSAENPSSIEDFDRYFQNGEPAIGPVATPMPDDAYVAQPSSILKVNPGDATNTGTSDIWILTRGSDNQNALERWIPIQIPNQRVVEVANQDSNPPLATDIVKSVVAPVPDTSIKTPYVPLTQGNLLQQVFIQTSDVASSQNVFPKSATVVQQVPSVQQIVDVPQGNIKQVVQQQFIKDSYPVPPSLNPPSAPLVSKSFTVPPPLPPPVKGGTTSAKVVSSITVNPQPASSILISDKNGLLQQLRHIWVPTSSRTGRFISVPVTGIIPGKSVLNQKVSPNAAPITVSDTWVLNQNGPIPSFEQQKTIISPVVQGGKVVFQDSPAIQVDAPVLTQLVPQVDSLKNPTIGKSSNSPLNIWPTGNDINQNLYSKSVAVAAPVFPFPPAKSGAAFSSKALLPADPQKSSITNLKLFSPPSQQLQPVGPVINDKPCPIPPQKSLFPPQNPTLLSAPVPKIVATQNRLPLQRIVRVNRFPSGSYYLLNTRAPPNAFTYRAPAIIQQPKTGWIRLMQARLPVPVQSKQVGIPVQTKGNSIPVQSKVVQSPIPSSLVAYSLPIRQIAAPVYSPKSPTRMLYPAVQAIRYAYPWNSYIKANPMPGTGFIVPQSNSLKLLPIGPSSASSSSSEIPPEAASADKKEEKPKKDEISSYEEKEPIKESVPESTEREKEGEEATSESKPEDSFETAESQILHQAIENTATRVGKPYLFGFDNRDTNSTAQQRPKISDAGGRVTGSYGYQDSDGVFIISKYISDDDEFKANIERSSEPGTVTRESARVNFISNQFTDIEKSKTETQGPTAESYSTIQRTN